MRYQLFNIFAFVSIWVFVTTQLFSQCGCMSSITSGMLSPTTTIQTGTLHEGFLLINLLGNYTTGNREYSSCKIVPNSTVREFWNSTLSLSASYGITKKFTGTITLNYVLENNIKTYIFRYTNKGWNSVQLGAKYNLFFNPKDNYEITTMAGFSLPLQTVKDTTYMYLQPTSGAFAFSPGIFFHKGFNKAEIDIFTFWSSTLWTKNDANYQFGSMHQLTMGVTKPILKILSAGLLVNFAYKDKDALTGQIRDDSGYKTISISPQVMLHSNNFTLGLETDIPIYKEFFGRQITKEFSTSLNLQYKIDTN